MLYFSYNYIEVGVEVMGTVNLSNKAFKIPLVDVFICISLLYDPIPALVLAATLNI